MQVGNLNMMRGAVFGNFRPEVRDADPAVEDLVLQQTAVLWYNNTDKAYKYFDGTAIKPLIPAGGSLPDTVVLVDGSRPMTGPLVLDSEDQSEGADGKIAISRKFVETLLAKKMDKLTGAEDGVVVLTGPGGTLAFSAVTSAELAFLAGVTSNIQEQLDEKLGAGALKLTGDMDANSNQIINLSPPINPGQAARLVDVTQAMARVPVQASVLSVIKDASTVPVKTDGARYVLEDVTQIHPDFGSIDGAINNCIVAYALDVARWFLQFEPTASSAGTMVWDVAQNNYLEYSGTEWKPRPSSTYTQGDGIKIAANKVSVEVAGPVVIDDAKKVGLKFSAEFEAVAEGLSLKDAGVKLGKLDSTMFGTGLKVADGTLQVDFEGQDFLKDGGTAASLKITGAPVEDTDAANKKYVDDAIEAIDIPTSTLKKAVFTAEAAATTHNFKHDLAQRFGACTVFDADGNVIVPTSITAVDANNLTVVIPESLIVTIVYIA